MGTNSVEFFRENEENKLKNIPIVAGWNINNPTNIGSLIRIADNAGAKVVYILENNGERSLPKIKKSAGLSFKNVELRFVTAEEFLNDLPEGYEVVAIETATGSKNVYKTSLPEKVVLMVGSESHGIPEEFLSNCSHIVHIPMMGNCFSMNVSHALTVCLFEWIRQQEFC